MLSSSPRDVMNSPDKKRILIADDVRLITTITSRSLIEAGYEVAIANDGETCLEMVSHFKPDLIVLDLMMPKIHGIEILRRLRASPGTANIGVIVFSSKSFTTEQRVAEELGAFAFIDKSQDSKRLMGTVARFFSGDTVSTPSLSAGTQACYEPKLADQDASFRLWGTRGSTPITGGEFVRHGGNTSCLEIRQGDEMLILDAGSGIRDLGNEIAKRGTRRIHLLITHTHWDHIQGFPFFTPAYLPGVEINIYGAKGFGKNLEAIFKGQLDRDYFPIELKDMRADLRFHTLEQSPISIGGFQVFWDYAHHPGATVCYKVRVANKSVAWMPDNEFAQGYLGHPDQLTPDSPQVAHSRALIDFLRGTDLLIGEAQYLNQEYTQKIGWGHSSLSNACALMKLAGIQRWLVTHHDPMHTDRFLEQKLALTRQILHEIYYTKEVSHGYDGLVGYLHHLAP